MYWCACIAVKKVESEVQCIQSAVYVCGVVRNVTIAEYGGCGRGELTFGFLRLTICYCVTIIGLQLEGTPFLFSHIAYDLLYRHANTNANTEHKILQ